MNNSYQNYEEGIVGIIVAQIDERVSYTWEYIREKNLGHYEEVYEDGKLIYRYADYKKEMEYDSNGEIIGSYSYYSESEDKYYSEVILYDMYYDENEKLIYADIRHYRWKHIGGERKMSIGGVIKKLRTENNMTQEELANELSITVSYLSKIEKDKRNISQSDLIKLSNIFNINLLILNDFLSKFQSLDELEKYYSLRDLIEEKEIDDIEVFISTNGDKLIPEHSISQKNYCYAMVLSVKYKKYKESLEISFDTLNISDDTDLDTLKNVMYCNSELSIFSKLSIFVLITHNFVMLNNYKKSLKVCEFILEQ